MPLSARLTEGAVILFAYQPARCSHAAWWRNPAEYVREEAICAGMVSYSSP